ncbi:2,3-bisphosphoglycerate-independent phosphoglycerate mutase [uncultured Slackia sp.]|uniref:2,3-bisphosphoglycerate-independent phosphoglycerate mutase n=1 Tax=uncultured Slackia sp. TaxID=665903 RepID=UPI0026E0712D|nr:2,3-bisphosphoglycerate-independent phosphoglycerate mutase [uncultured Slackia sp.]
MNSKLRLPALLVIMDGFGLDAPSDGNAISLADTPRLDDLFESRPFVALEASGEAVGLPAGQMGNSEVGHLNIGAGRVVYQELTRIDKACREGAIRDNDAINEAIDAATAAGGALHLMGLLSDGGVHSSNEHLYALVRHAVARGSNDVRIHCFMDGRDVSPRSGAGFIEELESVLAGDDIAGKARIASVSGRYYAMDRDKRWDRVQRAYEAVACGIPHRDVSAKEAIEASYAAEVTDEFVEPVSLDGRGMRDGDAAIFFNFRPDRARELTRALVDVDFDGFERCVRPAVKLVCLTEYDATIDAPVAFPKEFPENVLADVLAAAQLRQYHIAETEKYAHVTFFFNGGVEACKEGESRSLVASPKVATYDLQPEMSEPEVADTLAAAIAADEADVYIVNFANCDMVGHTGVIPAAKAAVEAVDAGVGKVVDAVLAKGGFALVTADHGNADKMIAEDGSPYTAHTSAPVPLALVDDVDEAALGTPEGRAAALCDIAPTLLDAIGLAAPEEMTGASLLRR